MMDVLRNQIIERKVIELILAHAKFKEVPYELEGDRRRSHRSGGRRQDAESEIPEAKQRRRGRAATHAEGYTHECTPASASGRSR